MKQLFLFIGLLAFQSYGQVDCDEIPDNYTGNCHSYDQLGHLHQVQKFENGVLIEKVIYNMKGDTTDHSTFSGKNDLTSSYRKFSGNIINIDIQQINGSGTIVINYPFGGKAFVGQTKDSVCTGDWYHYSETGELLIQLSGYAVKGVKCTTADELTKMMLENIGFMQNMYSFAKESNRALPWIISSRGEYIKEMEVYVKRNAEEKIVPPPVVYEEVSASEELHIQSEVIDFPEVEASYPGGQTAMAKFIGENVVYPKEAIEKGIQGRVYSSAVVLEDGSLTEIRVVRGISPELDAEAIRVISMMPKWIPGEVNGKKAKIRIRIPITFQLSDE